jgi:hypothetical protein
MSDGKRLESLVSYLEESLKPKGLTVEKNDKVFDDDGNQIAEFDIIVSGKFGSTEMKWLIECRDRPSSGAAPGSWIEQLVGRRDRFAFDKVTAVSTTGFAPGLIDYAKSKGIELRSVSEVSPEEFSGWFQTGSFPMHTSTYNLKHARVNISPDLPKEIREELLELLKKSDANSRILQIADTDAYHSLNIAFRALIEQQKLFDDIQPNGEAKKVKIHARYPNPDYRYLIQLPNGAICVDSINFIGELSITTTELPIAFSARYKDHISDTVHSEVVGYEPMEAFGSQITMELHKIAETGEKHVTLRKIK